METYSWYDVCKAVYMKSESFTFLDPASLVFLVSIALPTANLCKWVLVKNIL